MNAEASLEADLGFYTAIKTGDAHRLRVSIGSIADRNYFEYRMPGPSRPRASPTGTTTTRLRAPSRWT